MFAWLISVALASPSTVAEAVSLGDCAAVLAARPPASLDARTPDGEVLAVAWCLRRGAPVQVREAVAWLDDPSLAPYGRWITAEAQARAGDPAAVDTLDGVDLPGAAGLEVRLLRGRALVAAGRSLQAREGLRSLLDTDVGVEARYWLAVGGRDRGEQGAARATFERVWVDAVSGPWGARAAEALAGLGAPVPDPTSPDGRGLIARRIDALERAYQFPEALALRRLLRAETPTPPDAAFAHALFRARAYPEAVAAWRAVLDADAPSGPTGDPASLFELALATSRLGDYATAADVYGRLIAQHPRSDEAVEASFKLGYLPYDRGDCDAAVPALGAHVDAHPRSPFVTSALWFAGWCRFEQQRHDEALAWWGRLVETRPTSDLVPGARYWTARIAGLRGDRAGERRDLVALRKDHPDSAHAWLVGTSLGLRWPARRAVDRPRWPDRLDDDPHVVAAEALLAAGFGGWAADHLAELVPRAGDRTTALALAHALIAAGDARTALRVARRWCDDDDPVAQQACWPRPERAHVDRVAAARGVHPLLPYAVMWTESAFAPEATSLAGARGLMQVMPEVGERLHATAALAGPFDPDLLWHAPYNAVLGVTELGVSAAALAGQLDGPVWPAAIAAYNGGADAVVRWVAQAGGPPLAPDRFVEEVGYVETRRYVRRVLDRLAAYERIYGTP